MSESATPRTPEQWDAIFERFLSSGLTQAAFCKAESIVRYSFAYHYRRSDRFAGKRRGPTHAAQASPQQESGFRSVQHKPTASAEPTGTESLRIDIGDDQLQLHCSAAVGIEAIIRLVREARA